ncbi:hypothetical protein H4F51_14455 [Pectobacterium brasiliense]|uniref:hypothetical protein n=1 Tax=Pectobacterium brasiliense TaxID=180957 RepID=UPI0015DDE771|nr:hypothetical protein [Pectobacterium brasiliense]MBA0196345.1 hypothetical protein [Pectobacterium brasiliense]MBN3093235.1 hypothetical protein [Pectobacterium brasiliense]MBN3141116.1 hypothetical protein [Pectobacterium brasiliense]MBW5896104.1 hypothetical protein [Pectobacterium brasiliense]
MITIRPNPHPLDYDWRFSDKTAERLVEYCADGKTLSVGVPTVAAILSEKGKEVVLVDSHPIQDLKNHILIDINFSEPLKDSYNFVVMDPPWYLDVYYRWLSWAAISAGVGAKIFLSIWPDNTRPLAISEKKELFEWVLKWADIEYFEGSLYYETPLFEKMSNFKNKHLQTRKGDLVIITINSIPALKKITPNESKWIRYLFNDYQIAVKCDEDNNEIESIKLDKLDQANSWIWPSVSKRVKGRELIQLWSSENEVGQLDNPSVLIKLLDQLIETDDLNKIYEKITNLKEWDIPSPPYSRKLKWTQEF